jgi:octaprenyl-diphosphate synthase
MKGTTMSDDSSLPTSVATGSPPTTVTLPGTAVRAVIEPLVIEPLCTASNRVGLADLAARLSDLRLWMADDLSRLETDLGDVHALADGQEDHDVARRAAAHLLAQPGKRIRPLCVMLGAQLAGVAVDERVRSVAVACELIHAATLLHDDVIDEGTERRGAAAARVVYGNSASILGGDYLLVEALERVAAVAADCLDPARSELLPGLLNTITQMVAAEALQLELRGSFRPDRSTYLQVIDGKTASLFRWALSAAGLLGGMPSDQRQALATAGTALGMAFQLIDDVLDFEGDPGDTGKDLFADLRQGKLTWPLIVAATRDETLTDDVRLLCERAICGELDADAAAHIVERISATGALDDTRAFAEQQRDGALAALGSLPDSAARRALELVVHAAVGRRH